MNYSQSCASVFWEDPDVLLGFKENCPELVREPGRGGGLGVVEDGWVGAYLQRPIIFSLEQVSGSF